MAELGREEIRRFWTRQALEHGQSSDASWSDRMLVEMEVREVARRLEDGDRVLDVGCGNGYSTVQFAATRKVSLRGVDYIPEMIAQARLRHRALADTLAGTVEFDVGDVTALDEAAGTYDKVISVRTLINLGEWTFQLRALRECARVLRRGGLLLLSEATCQGWRRLNRLRREWGLDAIPVKPFNEYLDEERLTREAGPDLEPVEIVDFSSTYYVGTRVLKPLLIARLHVDLDPADPLAEWNRWCAQLPSWGDYGIQRLFVFRKA